MRTHSSLALLLITVACGSPSAPPPSTSPAPVVDRTESLGDKLSAEQFVVVADGVHEGPAIAVADVLANPAGFMDKTLRIEGTIQRVCKTKGCWFEVGTDTQSIHVTFARGCEEYVPLDAEGRVIRFEGKLAAKPSDEERKHIEEDMQGEGGSSPNLVLSVVATGAVLPK